jgi:CspA family cold shock protein
MNAIAPAWAQNPTVKATLKWFDVEKGFGFVVLDSDKSDVYLHLTILKRAGVESLGQGAHLLCKLKQKENGPYVSEVVSVLNRGIRPVCIDRTKTDRVAGTVTFYDPRKGYGFIAPDDGGKDIFIHRKFLTKVGLEALVLGTRVIAIVGPTLNGRQAVDLEITQHAPSEGSQYQRANKKAAV